MIITVYRVNGIHWGTCGPQKMMQAKRDPSDNAAPWDCLIVDRGYFAGDIIEESLFEGTCICAKRNGEVVYKYDRERELREQSDFITATLKEKNIFHPLYNPRP